MNGSLGPLTRSLVLLGMAVGLCAGTPTAPAGAQPPGFPDFDEFAAVPVDDYFTTGPGRWVSFATPYNIACRFEAPAEAVPVGSSQDILCDGDMPGLASAPLANGDSVPGGCVIGTVRSQGAAGLRLNRESTSCGRQFTSGAFLGVGQKVSYRNVTCAVGADQLIACLDTSLGHHGFVLRPSGSSAF